ncbi:MAG TPA: vWA domain-containing protein [Kofleriaceae bacterium]|nr:vWA domain-containing protein [Kofleriaceae bacterium]
MSIPVRPPRLGGWLRRHSLTLVATLGGAAGVALAVARYHPQAATPPAAQAATPAAAAAPAPAPAELPRDTVLDTVQIALVLDTSSSMNGLINQARSHLWKMVDDLGTMTRVVDGKVRGVRVELALYEYGNDTLPAKGGYIRQVLPLTTDLDKVSEQLHALFTNGGSEYAGQAIETAVTSLAWSSDPSALRFVLLAGNESFDQGPVTAAKAMALAASKDITVQLVHCGGPEASWSAAAALAKSDLLTIDQNRVAQHIPAPQDDEILQLGAALNATYLAYGADGQAAAARQASADVSSAKLSKKVAVERNALKAKAAYKNDRWDVVDAVDKDAGWLARTPDRELPAELRGKSLAEKQQLVAAKAAERAALKARIGKLEAERTRFVEAERAKQAGADAPSLETEMKKSTRKAAAKKGYQL